MKHSVNEIHKFVMKNKTEAIFNYCESSKLVYSIDIEESRYTFPIDVSDKKEVGDARFGSIERASLLMRYFKKAIEKSEVREESINL